MVKFDDAGLAPAVVQDASNEQVLMVAHVNREALQQTLETGRATFWSRSRQKLWIKGETSGHTQQVREILIDCDGDCILMKVEQVGAACHTGFRTCFFRRAANDGELEQVVEPVVDMSGAG